MKADGSESYRPHHGGNNNYKLSIAAFTTGTHNGNVQWGNYNDTRTQNTDPYKDHQFALTVGTGVSYTWMFNTANTAPLTLAINKKGLVEDATKSYYLIGNFQDASATVDIKPYEDSGRSKMVRLIYRKALHGVGIPSTADFDPMTMDSVVYRTTIPRPAAGWGELYLAVAAASKVEGSTAANWTGDPVNNWHDVIRPQVQTLGTGGPAGTGMDGTALTGGVFWCDRATNYSQALNPLLSGDLEDAESYTFSMNLTTSTYRITFNTDVFYLTGTGVKDKAAGNTTVEQREVKVNRDGTEVTETWNAIPLTWVDEEQCYKNIVEGNEAPVYLEEDAHVRFVYGMKWTNSWFGENGNSLNGHSEANPNVPADLIHGTKAYTAFGPGYDTQYVNYIQTYQSKTNVAQDPTKSFFFELPATKGYIIRMYMKKIGGEVKYFYTVNRKISFSAADGLADGEKLENKAGEKLSYYRSFSEWHACKIPAGVSVFTVTAKDASARTATVTDITDLGYIPARTGVILAKKDAGSVEFETYVDNPEQELPTDYTNLLVPCVADATIDNNTVVGGTTKYNYVFYALPQISSGKVELGFYHPAAGFKSGRNFSYLQIDENVLPGSGTAPAKAFRLLLNNTVTGIKELGTAEKATTDNAYYTLQGVRVASPTRGGIYIHNGKKIIIK